MFAIYRTNTIYCIVKTNMNTCWSVKQNINLVAVDIAQFLYGRRVRCFVMIFSNSRVYASSFASCKLKNDFEFVFIMFFGSKTHSAVFFVLYLGVPILVNSSKNSSRMKQFLTYTTHQRIRYNYIWRKKTMLAFMFVK